MAKTTTKGEEEIQMTTVSLKDLHAIKSGNELQMTTDKGKTITVKLCTHHNDPLPCRYCAIGMKVPNMEEAIARVEAYFETIENPIVEKKIVDYDPKKAKEDEEYKGDVRIRLVAKEERLPTVTGLALALGLTRYQLRQLDKDHEYKPLIEAALARIEQKWEAELGKKSGQSAGIMFHLKNSFPDWYDKQEVNGNINHSFSLLDLHHKQREQRNTSK